MATTTTAGALTGVYPGDVILSAGGTALSSWTVQSPYTFDVGSYSVSLYSTPASAAVTGTINGRLVGSSTAALNARSYNTRMFVFGPSADLSAFAGTLAGNMVTTYSGGGFTWQGGSYTLAGTLKHSNEADASSSVTYWFSQPETTIRAGQYVVYGNGIYSSTTASPVTVTVDAPVSFQELKVSTTQYTNQINVLSDNNVILTGAVTGGTAGALHSKNGTGTLTFRGSTGAYLGTFNTVAGVTRIEGTNPLGTGAKLVVSNPSCLEIGNGGSHTFASATMLGNQAGPGNRGALSCQGTGTYAAATTTISNWTSITAYPTTGATPTAANFTVGSTGTQTITAASGTLYLSPDAGVVGGSRNTIRVRAQLKAAALTAESGRRTGVSGTAGTEGLVILYANPSGYVGTTTVASYTTLRVNSPDGSTRLCAGTTTVQASATLETELVAPLKGKHTYSGDLIINGRLNIGVVPA